MIRGGLCVLFVVCKVFAATASDARADVSGVVVVNGVVGEDASVAAADAVARLRAQLVDRGLALELPSELAVIVEGRHRPRYQLDLSVEQAAYRAFDYRKAERLLTVAQTEVLARARPDELEKTLSEVLLWRAIVALAKGREAAARRWLCAVARLTPRRTLPRTGYAPRVRRLFDKARACRRAEDAVLEIVTQPKEATIRVNGYPYRAQRTMTVGAGLHLIVVTHQGHERAARHVEVVPGGRLNVNIALEPEARIETIRRSVHALRASDAVPSWRLLENFAAALGVARLVLVRAHDGKNTRRLAVFMYDVSTRRQAPVVAWSAIDDPTSVIELVRQRELQLRIARLPEGDGVFGQPLLRQEKHVAVSKWYQKWWLWATVSAVAVGLGSVYAVSLRTEGHLRGFAEP